MKRKTMNNTFLTDEQAQPRLDQLRAVVAKAIPSGWTDPSPALIENTSMLVGNKYHASNVPQLVERGVTAVLNCASGGISRLPMDDLRASGIDYEFTNVRQDDYSYPILFDKTTGEASSHLQKAKAVYRRVRDNGGRVLFFCVAGQNRSAALAVAVLLLFGHSLDEVLMSLSQTRAFVLENQGFQRQLVELEHMLLHSESSKKIQLPDSTTMYTYASPQKPTYERRHTMTMAEQGLCEVELLIPGLCTMDVVIDLESNITSVKQRLIQHANEFMLKHYSSKEHHDTDTTIVVSKSWLVLAMFGYDDMYDIVLEREAIEPNVQLELMKNMFGLVADRHLNVKWNSKCRFALVIFSVLKTFPDGESSEEAWTFVHQERPAAPATFLDNNLLTTHLRAWDFVTGQSYCSLKPIVFSFSPDPRDKRQFMRISTRANKPVQFHAPGEGGILGLGANAIVHRTSLGPVKKDANSLEKGFMDDCPEDEVWDAAVKRHFSCRKMVAFLENRSEAGLAKRIRLASMLNSDGRVVEFYGLGVGLASNSYNEHEFKFEAMLLARYEEEFSTYTMKKFIHDYLLPVERAPPDELSSIQNLQSTFSLISVKVLLVSLLNAFRDLTLMGVQAFDFNHLSNVLVSRDHRLCRLIDIDGDSKGSIQLDDGCEYIKGSSTSVSPPVSPNSEDGVFKPSLDVDLKLILPALVEQLILGKGRGRAFVTNKRSEIWHSPPEKSKQLIEEVLLENFYPDLQKELDKERAAKHVHKVAQWFYAALRKQPPWGNWTRDIYDAMRCIDHLPIA